MPASTKPHWSIRDPGESGCGPSPAVLTATRSPALLAAVAKLNQILEAGPNEADQGRSWWLPGADTAERQRRLAPLLAADQLEQARPGCSSDAAPAACLLQRPRVAPGNELIAHAGLSQRTPLDDFGLQHSLQKLVNWTMPSTLPCLSGRESTTELPLHTLNHEEAVPVWPCSLAITPSSVALERLSMGKRKRSGQVERLPVAVSPDPRQQSEAPAANGPDLGAAKSQRPPWWEAFKQMQKQSEVYRPLDRKVSLEEAAYDNIEGSLHKEQNGVPGSTSQEEDAASCTSEGPAEEGEQMDSRQECTVASQPCDQPGAAQGAQTSKPVLASCATPARKATSTPCAQVDLDLHL
eukprot:SM002384S08054  [mRNA]  locus=s2384:32:1236:+ [translate_table: standard]